MLRVRRHLESSEHPTSKIGRDHETSHAVLPDFDTLAQKLSVNTRTSVGATAGRVDLANLDEDL